MPQRRLGLNIGSTCIKACMLADSAVEWIEITPHEGNIPGTLTKLLDAHAVPEGVLSLVTGPEGRRQVHLPGIIEPAAIEKALEKVGRDFRAVVSVGGEDLVVYALDGEGRVAQTYAGNKCASGTGEFFAQQLTRMNLDLDAVFAPETKTASVCRLSARCSVFMKSDCTHKLNKGEMTRHDVVLSLSSVMAKKIAEFLTRAHIATGRVLLSGGPTRNPHLVRFIREALPGVDFVLPQEAPYLEALGAAYLAAELGAPLPPRHDLFTPETVAFARTQALNKSADKVVYITPARGKFRKDTTYILGVDGGSTTTKVVLMDMADNAIVAAHYGRTLGDPITAFKDCLNEIKKQAAASLGEGVPVRIRQVATTGSSRELLGVFCGTRQTYNEILAHTVGSTHFDPAIDTLFEIGGQDAKYVSLSNLVPVDYAMNEACSAGTGSFLEEAAIGDLSIRCAEDIGQVAMEAQAPLLFGEHCSAFINSDIRKAIGHGATQPDIVAGLVLSIVANYLNRVVGNRRIGNHIVLQGGVAKNPAVPLAFATLLGKPIIVPPDPEMLGALGVGLLVLRKLRERVVEEADYSIDHLLSRTIVDEREYRCQACENLCPIRVIKVGESRHHFGGRCNKYANLRKQIKIDEQAAVDWSEVRRKLFFEKFAPAPGTLAPRTTQTVGIPATFGIHTLYPLYATFFHELGVPARLFSAFAEQDMARCESSFCFPAEAAHGMMGALIKSDVDFYFLPHFKRMESLEDGVHACMCPFTQGQPYYLRTAFGVDDGKILRPVLDFEHGFLKGAEPMVEVAATLGFGRKDALRAWERAVATQEGCFAEARTIGKRVIEESLGQERPVIVLFGRPYNAFASALNMGIPRKFATRGCTVLPFDFLPLNGEEIFPNMYWYYGQLAMKGAVQVKGHPNLFACYMTNFSCAPDSFILHYLRWINNSKPFLVLELDSHTADAGIDTRVEAFLDIVEAYRRTKPAETSMLRECDWNLRLDGERTGAVHRRTGAFRGLRHPKVKLLWPNMGSCSTELLSRISRHYGIDSYSLPVPAMGVAARARAVASGKECVPTLLVLGSFLDYFAKQAPDPQHVYLLFMPSTTGPCRVGQYAVFFQNLFQELGYTNVLVLNLSSDNSYTELGPVLTRLGWVAITLGDVLQDMEYNLRTLAKDPVSAEVEFKKVMAEIAAMAERHPKAIMKNLKGWAGRLGRIPLKQSVQASRKVMVVGEIYVRRDDYSVGTLMTHLSQNGIVVKIEGGGEWIDYMDYDQVYRYTKKLRALPVLQRLFSPELRKLAALRIEMYWKDWMERRIMRALKTSRLVIEGPSDMETIMERAPVFTSLDFDTEATLSTCTASVAMQDGFHGVAVVAPFACLPGRLVESLYGPWARARNYPVICLENDGNPYPPNVVSRIEMFIHNVKRSKGAAESACASRLNADQTK